MSSSPEQGVRVQAYLGDEDHVRSLMLDFRKLWSNDDDAHFYSICNIMQRRLTDPELIDSQKANRESWNRMLSGKTTGHVNFVRDGRTVAGNGVLDVWINGVLFHNDPDDQAFFDCLDSDTQLLFRQQVNAMVMTMLRIAHAQRNLVAGVLSSSSK